MTRDQILAAIEEIAERQLRRPVELALDMRLIEDLRLDSIALLSLSIDIENRFRVRLDETGVAGVETIGELVETIAALLSAQDEARLR